MEQNNCWKFAVWVIEVVSVSESFLLMPTHGSMATLLLNRICLIPKFSSYRVTRVYRLREHTTTAILKYSGLHTILLMSISPYHISLKLGLKFCRFPRSEQDYEDFHVQNFSVNLGFRTGVSCI